MLEINWIAHFLETTTLMISVVDTLAATDVGALTLERRGNTEYCKRSIHDLQFLGYLGLLPRG